MRIMHECGCCGKLRKPSQIYSIHYYYQIGYRGIDAEVTCKVCHNQKRGKVK